MACYIVSQSRDTLITDDTKLYTQQRHAAGDYGFGSKQKISPHQAVQFSSPCAPLILTKKTSIHTLCV